MVAPTLKIFFAQTSSWNDRFKRAHLFKKTQEALEVSCTSYLNPFSTLIKKILKFVALDQKSINYNNES